jgi:hypothetical protein
MGEILHFGLTNPPKEGITLEQTGVWKQTSSRSGGGRFRTAGHPLRFYIILIFEMS